MPPVLSADGADVALQVRASVGCLLQSASRSPVVGLVLQAGLRGLVQQKDQSQAAWGVTSKLNSACEFSYR